MKFILLFFFASHFLLASEVNSHAPIAFYLIPYEDQLEIRQLFREIFKYEEFAYSLYGDKPMSFSDSLLNPCSANQLLQFLSLKDYCKDTLENFVEPKNLFNQRWNIWKKYNNQFNLNKYLLIEKKIGNQRRVFFINISAFKKIVNLNIQSFKKIIHPDISAETLLDQFKDENMDVFTILNNNKGLLGILLGFGTHNSFMFQKREDLLNLLERKEMAGIHKLEYIQKRLRLIDAKLKIFHEHDAYIIASLNRVMFLANPNHPETIQLRNKYDDLNRKINQIYSQEDWFEQTLIQLTSD
jgi:hypothetical protein